MPKLLAATLSLCCFDSLQYLLDWTIGNGMALRVLCVVCRVIVRYASVEKYSAICERRHPTASAISSVCPHPHNELALLLLQN
jgi:hypothetical protein